MENLIVIENVRQRVDDMFKDAIEKNASDIHIEPQKDYVLVRYRIDWELFPIFKISNESKDNLITRVKILSQLKIDENRIPQDWQIMFEYKKPEVWKKEDIDMRVSTFPTLYWEKIVIRILRKDWNLLNLDRIGFLSINLNLIKKALSFKEWLILVAWPTWSWKTTTLYAMLNWFDPKKYNISTLEDPIEYKIPWINQSQVKPEIGYTFSVGLKTLLRQDPDIILVWEIRDTETAKLAIEASLTWHLVLWTIHATKWIGVVERLVNMWIEPYLIAWSLKMIISQRLVKRLCNCAELIKFEWEDFVSDWLDYWKIFKEWLGDSLFNSLKNKIKLRKTKWCDICFNTGYKWRIPIHEVVLIDKDFAKLIWKDLNDHLWNDLMIQKWYLNLYQDGLIKVLFWLTDLKQVLPYKSL